MNTSPDVQTGLALHHSPIDRGFTAKFKNGWEVSVQWGTGNYGSNRGRSVTALPNEATTVEVAIFKPDGEVLGNPQGWQTPEQVAETLFRVSQYPATQ